MRADLGQRSIAFVRTVDDHANQRIKAMLAPFGPTAQNMEVFTDGDNQLRQWQQSTLRGSKHILDWYHLRPAGESTSSIGSFTARKPPTSSSMLIMIACRSWSTPFSGVCGMDEVARPFENWKSCKWY